MPPKLNTPLLSEAKARADKELSHLTKKRLPGHHAAKRWESAPLMRDMANVIEVFIATAAAQKLDPDFVVLVKKIITDFRRP